MKHIKIILAAAVIATTLFSVSSCKKGEEDPFLSFKSRDGRLAGDWVLVAIDGNVKTTYIFGSNTTMTTQVISYSNGVQTTATTTGSGTSTSTNKYTFDMTFEKDGNFRCLLQDKNGSGTQSEEGNGQWRWISDGKNKSNIVISEGSGSFIADIWEVHGLKSKTLKLRQYSRDKEVNGSDTYEEVRELIYTFEAK